MKNLLNSIENSLIALFSANTRLTNNELWVSGKNKTERYITRFKKLDFLKLVVILILFTSLVACSDDDNYNDPLIESAYQVSIDSVKIPQSTMQVYTTQTIKTYSTLKDNCEGFFRYDYQQAGFSRNIVSYAFKIYGAECDTTTYKSDNGFNFRPEVEGIYTFNFLSKSSTGIDSLIVKTIEVTN